MPRQPPSLNGRNDEKLPGHCSPAHRDPLGCDVDDEDAEFEAAEFDDVDEPTPAGKAPKDLQVSVHPSEGSGGVTVPTNQKTCCVKCNGDNWTGGGPAANPRTAMRQENSATLTTGTSGDTAWLNNCPKG